MAHQEDQTKKPSNSVDAEYSAAAGAAQYPLTEQLLHSARGRVFLLDYLAHFGYGREDQGTLAEFLHEIGNALARATDNNAPDVSGPAARACAMGLSVPLEGGAEVKTRRIVARVANHMVRWHEHTSSERIAACVELDPALQRCGEYLERVGALQALSSPQEIVPATVRDTHGQDLSVAGVTGIKLADGSVTRMWWGGYYVNLPAGESVTVYGVEGIENARIFTIDGPRDVRRWSDAVADWDAVYVSALGFLTASVGGYGPGEVHWSMPVSVAGGTGQEWKKAVEAGRGDEFAVWVPVVE